MLGNDIVDYSIDEQKYQNPRFINRILNDKEQAYLNQSPDPNRFLWSLWAAKEAGYKALQRNDYSLIFSPLTLELAESSLQQLLSHDVKDALWGEVHFEKQIIELKFNWPKPSVVHCLACCKTITDPWTHIDSRVSYSANLNSYQQQSQAVRILAKKLLQRHNINAEILRPNLTMGGYDKPGPPILIHNVTGEALPHIISLSHDNGYLATAVCLALE